MRTAFPSGDLALLLDDRGPCGIGLWAALQRRAGAKHMVKNSESTGYNFNMLSCKNAQQTGNMRALLHLIRASYPNWEQTSFFTEEF